MKKFIINAKILHFGSLLAKAPLLEQGLRFMKKGFINAKILHSESLIAKPLLQQELPTCGPLIYFAQPVYTVFLTWTKNSYITSENTFVNNMISV
jgi:hypothetical protein